MTSSLPPFYHGGFNHGDRLVPPFPDKPINISSYIHPTPPTSAWSPSHLPLRRPSSFYTADQSSTYGSVIYKQDPSIYGYALVQNPYLVPVGTVGTASVYMSCYTTNYGTITTSGTPQPPPDAHYYVNGNFLAEAAERMRIEVNNVKTRRLGSFFPLYRNGVESCNRFPRRL